MYTPKFPPMNADQRALQEYVSSELQRIAQSQSDSLDSLQLNVLNVAPKKPRNGMIVEADGVNFNPGAGAGCYIRRAGAWVKLG